MTPRDLDSTRDIERSLRRVGELLEAAGEEYAIVIVGGAALNLLGVLVRSTRDVDILALAERHGGTTRLVPPPSPLPLALRDAIRTVGRDAGLADEWLNTGPAAQWTQGLPPDIDTGIVWRRYGALTVGIVGRPSLVALKLFAAVDDRPGGRHERDLLALEPTDEELDRAEAWVRTQDASVTFPALVDEVLTRVRAHRRRSKR